ncbi:hypothetical protein DFJ73DRAFT_844130 [Zopfochytrium polystomum]|nr:hypothetical protein DFJ73DRAFT_844130 [Zopfochytrium polystomum]
MPPRTAFIPVVCKFFIEGRCREGTSCRFIHPSSDAASVGSSTPISNETCRYFLAGVCRFGSHCRWSHSVTDVAHLPDTPPNGKPSEANPLDPEEQRPATPDEDDVCGICFEKPSVYGLLQGCDHRLCLPCITEWRKRTTIEASNFFELQAHGPRVKNPMCKTCPMCRVNSYLVIPSNRFFPRGAERDAVFARFKESRGRIPCRYFLASKERGQEPSCPFGDDCLFQHNDSNGNRVSVAKRSRRRPRHPDLSAFTEIGMRSLTAAQQYELISSLFSIRGMGFAHDDYSDDDEFDVDNIDEYDEEDEYDEDEYNEYHQYDVDEYEDECEYNIDDIVDEDQYSNDVGDEFLTSTVEELEGLTLD